MKQKCRVCGKETQGRSDKKSCAADCKKPRHSAPRRDTRGAVAEIDGCPHRNREILATLPGNAVKVELDRLVLTRTDFRCEYHTGTSNYLRLP